jgi:hypothetical protein
MTEELPKPKRKWYDSQTTVILLCLLFFPIGLYALWKSNTITKTWKVVFTIIISLIVISQIAKQSDSHTAIADNSSTSNERTSSARTVRAGEVLHSAYFDVVVNKVELADRVSTGNEFSDLNAEQGIKYLIINASFKNTDKESRMLTEGTVWINYNGKDYQFDKSETVLAEGWGLFLDQINPLTVKTTNIVYKLPDEIKGVAYWQPGRSSDDEKITLGSLN